MSGRNKQQILTSAVSLQQLFPLLSLLQAQRAWTGAQLAARLGVTARTVCSDVELLPETRVGQRWRNGAIPTRPGWSTRRW